ncbi:citrate (Si)-synthase [bacterium]|nr:citrate (Si)-synthase [bacterium]
MTLLHDRLAQLLPGLRSERSAMLAQHAELELCAVSLGQVYGGLRGVIGVICDTSVVDPQRGLIIRGRPVRELTGLGVEEVFWLLLCGEYPDKAQKEWLRAELASRARVPDYAWSVLASAPPDSHPMVLFSLLTLSLQRSSRQARDYHELGKESLWRATLEDALDLLARLPVLAAAVWHRDQGRAQAWADSPAEGSWSERFAAMLSLTHSPPAAAAFADLLRLYFVLHCDHEGSNACALACHTVGSAHSDACYSISAGLNALAGPIHGLASEMTLRFVLAMHKHYGSAPSEGQIEDYCQQTLAAGRVLPGFGHAVLRAADPRFVALHSFAAEHISVDPLYATADHYYRIGPAVLASAGKAKSIHPNVDAITGPLLHHYGLTELRYYTVMFGLGLSIGMLAQLVLNRALGSPIMRPRSASLAELRELTGTG